VPYQSRQWLAAAMTRPVQEERQGGSEGRGENTHAPENDSTFNPMQFAFDRRQPSETALLFEPGGRAGSPAKMHSEQIHDVQERAASPRQSFALLR
jgi:hypothetical protein